MQFEIINTMHSVPYFISLIKALEGLVPLIYTAFGLLFLCIYVVFILNLLIKYYCTAKIQLQFIITLKSPIYHSLCFPYFHWNSIFCLFLWALVQELYIHACTYTHIVKHLEIKYTIHFKFLYMYVSINTTPIIMIQIFPTLQNAPS